jgi:hypothetical protein
VNLSSGPETVRPPVALGCFFALAVVVLVAGMVAFGIVFLESGANTGQVGLEAADAYAPGTVEFISEENVFLVRLANGDFLSLADLDAANRANQGRNCRVGLVPMGEPSLGISVEVLRTRMSIEAAGATSVFYEPCLGSIYDVAGARLNGPGANLERHPVAVNAAGRVVIDLSERECSRRTEAADFVSTAC